MNGLKEIELARKNHIQTILCMFNLNVTLDKKEYEMLVRTLLTLEDCEYCCRPK